ncbi:MAG TPA: hypothetical protein VNI83_14040 [Vicinamibacterales bacterium]|nr:hypothetical protein [Vicinamibacterales bacterium]
MALFLEAFFEGPGGVTHRTTAVYDNFLRDGSRTLSGTVAWVQGNWQTRGRARYVEYSDGSFEGDLPEPIIRRVFFEVREALSRYAQRYAELARSGGRAAVEAALAAEQPSSAAAERAVNQIRLNLRSASDDAELIALFRRLAHR